MKKKSSTGNGVKDNEDLLAATPPEQEADYIPISKKTSFKLSINGDSKENGATKKKREIK